ncbi:MFS transporter [Aestuariivirga sp.]|uniref:MFS transporter n=1 Tax=Aestuariivirga sp. TaxID=2650926 RepID=UPI0039E3ABAB
MAMAAGLAVANIYYNQPMLGVISRDLGSPGVTGLIPTATQLGYALGLMLLVPLGDLMDRRKLIVTQYVMMAVAVLGVAMAPTPALIIAASLLLGICSTAAQQLIPFAAALALPENRGKTVGIVVSGVLCGILASRTVSGFVAAYLGWRSMFVLAAPLALAAGALMAWLLPRNFPYAHLSYGAALKSVGLLWLRHPTLRAVTLSQAALFATFSTFWTTLALHLQEPPYELGSDVAGLFGLIGIAGVLAAPLAGRVADRRGPRAVVIACSLITLLSWAVFGLWDKMPGLILGVVLLDFGIQGALVPNQTLVFTLDPAARNRLNTVFVTGMFLGAAFGSAGAAYAWHHWGWTGVSAFGFALAALATLLALRKP